MAALIAPIVGEVAALLGGTGIGATIARGALTGVAAIGAGDLIKALEHDLGAGGSTAASARRLVPRYAIVDLHGNKVVKTLTAHRVYVILTHKQRRSRARHERVIVAPAGSEVVTVR